MLLLPQLNISGQLNISRNAHSLTRQSTTYEARKYQFLDLRINLNSIGASDTQEAFGLPKEVGQGKERLESNSSPLPCP